MPRVLGQTVESQQKKSAVQTGRQQWDESSFFAEARDRLPSSYVEVLRKIFDWSLKNLPRMTFGHGRYNGSFSAAVDLPGGSVWHIPVYIDGSIEFQFQHMRGQPVFNELAIRMQFLEKFDQPMNEETLHRRPSIPARDLVGELEIRKLIDALDWFVTEAKAEW